MAMVVFRTDLGSTALCYASREYGKAMCWLSHMGVLRCFSSELRHTPGITWKQRDLISVPYYVCGPNALLMQLCCTPSKPRFQPIEFVRLGLLWRCMRQIYIEKRPLLRVFLRLGLWTSTLSGSTPKLHRPLKCSVTVKSDGYTTKSIHD
ncbi:hypothetical protein BDY19DRAFT_654233 [Irpex rosettiformis]|uniref:Uncharacterized protein n=1 Tax=Irpex rosettiformis TaxID=378272 RepID=A0ACB8TNE8_9APHY|nr:hypothetical protein BDY19DRAFT_654233 [Irpex rosettiformis]